MLRLFSEALKSQIPRDVRTVLQGMHNAFSKITVDSYRFNALDIFSQAFDADPRMMFACQRIQLVTDQQQGILRHTYTFQVEYCQGYRGGHDLDDVIVDDGDIAVADTLAQVKQDLLHEDPPSCIRIVSKNENRWILSNDEISALRQCLPALRTVEIFSHGHEINKTWKCVCWEFRYAISDINALKRYRNDGIRRASAFMQCQLQQQIHCHGPLTDFMKVYLAHNYLAINFTLTECEPDEDNIIDYTPYTASGAFDGTANWRGMQEAMILLLRELGINALPICGFQNRGMGKEYGWVMVQLSDGWYHIDPASAWENNRLKFNHFMLPDDEMLQFYTWYDNQEYPEAIGQTYSFSEIRRHVRQNASQYDCINNALLMPWLP